MIVSERQLKAAKKKAKLLEKSIKKMEGKKGPLVQPTIIQTQAMLKELQDEVSEYEALLGQGLEAIKIEFLKEIMLLPIKYRVAKNLSREDFAKEVGLPVRMIARYEAGGYTNINGETFKKILDTLPLTIEGIRKKA